MYPLLVVLALASNTTMRSPLQMDLSTEIPADASSPSAVVLYLGNSSSIDWPSEQKRGWFVGAGIEATLAEYREYRFSGAGGLRLGYAWNPGAAVRAQLPRGFLYLRFAPFVGVEPARQNAQAAVHVSDVGFRFGVGVTAPAWGDMVAHAVDAAIDVTRLRSFLAVALGGLVALVDHVELTWEVHGQPQETRAVVRIGTGF